MWKNIPTCLLFKPKGKGISALQKTAAAGPWTSWTTKLQNTTSKLVTDLSRLQNRAENGELLQSRHISTFLHELMLHLNGLSII